jgi:hypothetical protein
MKGTVCYNIKFVAVNLCASKGEWVPLASYPILNEIRASLLVSFMPCTVTNYLLGGCTPLPILQPHGGTYAIYCTHPHVQGFRGIDLLTAWQKKFKIECCTFLRPGKKIIEGRASNRHFKMSLADKFAEAEIFSMTSYNYLCTYDLYSSVHIVLDACISITRGSGRGLGPGIREFFGPGEMASSCWRVQFGAKKMDMHASKTLCTGLYKSLVHK